MWVMGECVELYLPSIPSIVWLPCPNNVNAPSQSSQRSWVVFIDPEKRGEGIFCCGFKLWEIETNIVVCKQLLFNWKQLVIDISVTWSQHWAADMFWFWHCMLSSAQWFDSNVMIGRMGKKSAIFSNCSLEWNWFTPNRAWNNIGRWHCCYCAWNTTQF